MNKKIILLFTILTLSSVLEVFSQETINKFDENGKRTGVWKKKHSNNRIRYQGQFLKGKEIGTFKYYDISDSEFPILIKKFHANSDSASVAYYTVKGILTGKGTMIGKNRVGKWQFFHADGKKVMSEENYKQGVLDGDYKIFYKTGILTEASFYKDGKLHGNSKLYSDIGTLLSNLNYVKGKLQGDALYYDVNGNLIMKGVYEDNLKIGTWEYFENGKSVGPNRIKSK